MNAYIFYLRQSEWTGEYIVIAAEDEKQAREFAWSWLRKNDYEDRVRKGEYRFIFEPDKTEPIRPGVIAIARKTRVV